MVDDRSSESRSLDLIFHALSDSTRRELLKMLTRKEYTIGELAEPFSMSLNAVSKHIKVLEDAGLLKRERDGRIHRCTMDAAPLKKAQNIIHYYQQFWSDRFNALERFFEKEQEEEKNNGTRKK